MIYCMDTRHDDRPTRNSLSPLCWWSSPEHEFPRPPMGRVNIISWRECSRDLRSRPARSGSQRVCGAPRTGNLNPPGLREAGAQRARTRKSNAIEEHKRPYWLPWPSLRRKTVDASLLRARPRPFRVQDRAARTRSPRRHFQDTAWRPEHEPESGRGSAAQELSGDITLM